MDENTRKIAEASFLSRMDSGIIGKPFGIAWIPEEEQALGYTSAADSNIHVAWKLSPYTDTSIQEASMLRMGVNIHEVMHQLQTNFIYTELVCKKLNQYEAAIFMDFANTLEDPAIEYFADQFVGGDALDALQYSIKRIYMCDPGIGHEKHAYQQLINALIQFGDMGLIKGQFTFPEAKEYFFKIAPLYNTGITCPDSRKRIDIAQKCMELTKPLWEEMVKDAEEMEKLLKSLRDFLKDHPHNAPKECEKKEDSSGRAARRNKIGKLSDEELENLLSESKNGDTDDKSSSSDESDSENESGSSDESDSKNESGNGDSSDESSDENSNDSDSSSMSSSSKSSSSSCSSNSDENKSMETADSQLEDKSQPAGEEKDSSESELFAPKSLADELAENEFETSDEALKTLEQLLNNEARTLEESTTKTPVTSEELPQYPIESPFFRRNVSNLNRKVKAPRSGSTTYQRLVNQYADEIRNLTKTLEDIFKEDMEEIVQKTSGNYNILRGSIGTTAKMFDKRKEPGNKKDIAVTILIDMSGSMSQQNRMLDATHAAIVLTESLSSLNIPHYILGFSADEEGCDAVHNHFVGWNHTQDERESLVCLRPCANNFDGYSIRYAGNILNDGPGEKKVLFVISDGAPACSTYYGYTGIEDTTLAIDNVRSDGNVVFGIAVGNSCDATLLQKMYGEHFIHALNPNTLCMNLCEKLRELILEE